MSDTDFDQGQPNQYYDRRAPEYEQIYYRDDPQRRTELAEEVNRLQKLSQGKQILDLACGTGYWLHQMSRTASKIVASDLSSQMLQVAREKKLGCPVDFVRSDLYALPIESHQFDLVSLGFWFSHHPKPDYSPLFESLIRPLKPGGRIWMIDNNPPAEGITREPVGQDEHGNGYIRRYLSSGEAYVIVKNYFSEQQLRHQLRDRFEIEQLVYGKCYWSVVLAPL